MRTHVAAIITLIAIICRASTAACADPPETVPWSFSAIGRPEPPHTHFDALARTALDRFLFVRLEEKGLEPSPPASPLALLRRLSVDLTGLPPTPRELDDFLADKSADAYERVVDRLLASPGYGERWARHWLDVVRFGESNGYEQNHIRPNAWPYRDYVIRSFNQDKPFPQFVAEQLAGDVLGKGAPDIEAATGFLVAGVHDTVGIATLEGSLQQRANDLEDIVSTVGATFLGLTVGCAKCHDHKFDPIPQQDYYRLAAVFAGVRHGERALGNASRTEGSRDELLRRMRRIEGAIADIDAAARDAVLTAELLGTGKRVPRPAVAARYNAEVFAPVKIRFVRFAVLATRDNAAPCLDELELYGPDSDANLALAERGASATASSLLPGYAIHQVRHLNDGKYGNSWSWISNQRGGGWAQIELPRPTVINRAVWSRDAGEPARYVDRLPTDYRLETSLDGITWSTVATGKDRAVAPEAIPDGTLRFMMPPVDRHKRAALVKELAELRGRLGGTGARRAYVGQFTAPDTIHVLKRGDVMRKREAVQPGALSQVPGLSAELSGDASAGEPGRRLALARWLVDPKNPFTARVLVNRVWQYHFGRGLAPTSSDFGRNGLAPSHPELLDWLARDFMEHGWRLKRLHRMIVTSYAYRQTSAVNPRGAKVDADNRLLWRMPLRRLEAEALRDAILQTSGTLERRMGGPGFALFKYRVVNIGIYEPLDDYSPATWRRSVYSLAARSIRDDLLGNFDCPESAQRAPRRNATTTPLQALSLLNGPFAVEQAKHLAERVQREANDQADAQVDQVFRLALGRPPTDEERRPAVALVQHRGLVPLCRAILNANEFMHY